MRRLKINVDEFDHPMEFRPFGRVQTDATPGAEGQQNLRIDARPSQGHAHALKGARCGRFEQAKRKFCRDRFGHGRPEFLDRKNVDLALAGQLDERVGVRPPPS